MLASLLHYHHQIGRQTLETLYLWLPFFLGKCRQIAENKLQKTISVCNSILFLKCPVLKKSCLKMHRMKLKVCKSQQNLMMIRYLIQKDRHNILTYIPKIHNLVSPRLCNLGMYFRRKFFVNYMFMWHKISYSRI